MTLLRHDAYPRRAGTTTVRMKTSSRIRGRFAIGCRTVDAHQHNVIRLVEEFQRKLQCAGAEVLIAVLSAGDVAELRSSEVQLTGWLREGWCVGRVESLCPEFETSRVVDAEVFHD